VDPTQDMIFGAYYLTLEEEGVKGEGRAFRQLYEVEQAYERGEIHLHALIQVRDERLLQEDGTYQPTTAGRIFFNEALPAGFTYINHLVGKTAPHGSKYRKVEPIMRIVETLADTSWRFHTASEVEPIPVPKYHRSGRPREDQQPDYVLWRPAGKVREDTEAIESALITKGKFVLATSELDRRGLTDEALIELYKAQNTTVERGFRFLKDPLFFASGLFLKKPERVMALLMVMGLCLLIYAACEQIVRGGLARREETLPEQRGKPTPTPTMRRVLQIFEGIEVLTIEHPGGRRSRVVLNLSELHRRILDLLGVAPHGSVDEG